MKNIHQTKPFWQS